MDGVLFAQQMGRELLDSLCVNTNCSLGVGITLLQLYWLIIVLMNSFSVGYKRVWMVMKV